MSFHFPPSHCWSSDASLGSCGIRNQICLFALLTGRLVGIAKTPVNRSPLSLVLATQRHGPSTFAQRLFNGRSRLLPSTGAPSGLGRRRLTFEPSSYGGARPARYATSAKYSAHVGQLCYSPLSPAYRGRQLVPIRDRCPVSGRVPIWDRGCPQI